MKKATIVSAEITGSSLINEVTLTAASALASTGIEVTTTALPDYRALGFSPNPAFDAKKQAAGVSESDLLVLIFPMIWCSAPASLKHWIELVFSEASQYEGKPMNSQGCMSGRRAMVVATLEDSDSIQHYDTVKTAMCDMLRPLFKGTLEYLGFTVLRPHFITGIQPAVGQAKERLSNEVADVFTNIRRRAYFNGPFKPADYSLTPSML
jgi:putative NADPH-quinone reductase